MQINAGREMKTVAEMRKVSESENIQVIALQEPYTDKGKVCSYGSNSRIVAGKKRGETAWAAIIVFDPSIVVMKMDHLSDSHIVCTQLDCGGTKTYLLSGYFQFSHPIDSYLERIGQIMRQFHVNKVIIWLDANAKSPSWYSVELSDEGEELENLIMEMNLYVVNEANNPKTYSSTVCEGNIDVTLVSEATLRTINGWKVHDGLISSDHNAITFELYEEVIQVSKRESTLVPKFN